MNLGILLRYDISFSDVIEELASYDIALWVGVAVGVAIFVVEIILIKQKVILSRREKQIDKAKMLGNVVTAEAICQNYNRRGGKGTGDDLYHCVYEYTVDGVKRRYAIAQSGHYPPRNITLYYISNPRNVFSVYDHDKIEVLQKILIYLIPLLTTILVMYLLGWEG